MLLSKYFFKTIKEIPSDAELKSHKLLIRGGYIKQVSAGIFSYLPIALRSLKKIEKIIREEMDLIDGYEVNLPVIMPATLWNETGRYREIGNEMLRFEDRIGRKMLLGMTHEEAVTDIARYVINSYKQLPTMLYQIQTKFRDEPRVRGGLIRVREFVMKDAYSFHTDQSDLNEYYNKAYKAYQNIFTKCGLPVISVSSDVGMMGGSGAHEFMAVTESGEDTIIICSSCDYRANRDIATAKRDYKKEIMKDPVEVYTPNLSSIEEVANFLKIDKKETLKSVIYSLNKNLIMCVIRGDIDINEIKLKNYLKVAELSFAEEHDLKKAGIVPGFASPVGLKNIRLIIDESVVNSSNLVSGSNKINYHTKNINFKRDFDSDEIIDISSVKEGEICTKCGKKLKICRGIEVGNIFKLGTKYSKAMNATYLDKNGKTNYIIMGCYGIGVGRLMASVVEVLSQENRIIWPITIAPFEIELISLASDKDNEINKISDGIYSELKKLKFEILYDNRNVSAGFKFNDADLIGSPIRVIISNKSLKSGGAEVIIDKNELEIIPLNKLTNKLIKIKEKLINKLIK